MVANSLVWNTITLFLHYLPTSGCFLHNFCIIGSLKFVRHCTLGAIWNEKSIYESTRVYFFVARLLPELLYRVKASVSTFYPLLWAGNLGQLDKEQTHFLPPPHKRCSHNYWEFHCHKNNRKKVWASTWQLCKELPTQYFAAFWLNLISLLTWLLILVKLQHNYKIGEWKYWYCLFSVSLPP